MLPGIGKKSAERIILELKEKIRKNPALRAVGAVKPSLATLEEDLISSLLNLGYKDRIAASVAKKVLKDADPGISLAEAVKRALKELMKDSWLKTQTVDDCRNPVQSGSCAPPIFERQRRAQDPRRTNHVLGFWQYRKFLGQFQKASPPEASIIPI